MATRVDFECQKKDFETRSFRTTIADISPSMPQQTTRRYVLCRRVVYVLIPAVTLLIKVNSFDSAILKLPVLLLLSTLAAALYASEMFATGRFGWRRTPVDMALFGFGALIVLSHILNPREHANESLALWVSFLLCYAAGSQLFREKTDLQHLTDVIAATAVVVCAVGFVQYFFADRLMLEFYLGADHRISGTLGNSTFLGAFVVIVLPFLSFRALEGRIGRRRRVVFSVLATCLILVLLLSQSRSSIVACIIAMMLSGLLVVEKRAKLAATAGVILLLAALVAAALTPNLLSRFSSAFDFDAGSTLARRTFFWSAAWGAFLASPISGHGAGSFETAILPYRAPDYWMVKSEDIVPHAHNELLELAVEFGFAGPALFLLIMALAVRNGVRCTITGRPQERLLAAGMVAALVGTLLDNIVGVSLRQPPTGALAWIIAGMLSSMPFAPEENTVHARAFHAPRWLSLAPVVVWAVFAVSYTSSQLAVINADSENMAGFVARGQGRADVALNGFRAAAELNPRMRQYLSNYALELLKAGRFEDALLQVRRLRESSPHYPKSNLVEAIALLSLNRPAEALESIQRELKLRSHPEAYFIESLIHQNLGNRPAQRDALKASLSASIKGKLDYQVGTVGLTLATLCDTEQERTEARVLLERLQATFPDRREIAAALSAIAGNPDKGVGR